MIGRRRKSGLASRATTSRKQTHLCLAFKRGSLTTDNLQDFTTWNYFNCLFVLMNGFICYCCMVLVNILWVNLSFICVAIYFGYMYFDFTFSICFSPKPNQPGLRPATAGSAQYHY